MIVKSLVVKIQKWIDVYASAYVNLLDEEDKEQISELIRNGFVKTVPLYSPQGHAEQKWKKQSQEARFHVTQW